MLNINEKLNYYKMNKLLLSNFIIALLYYQRYLPHAKA